MVPMPMQGPDNSAPAASHQPRQASSRGGRSILRDNTEDTPKERLLRMQEHFQKVVEFTLHRLASTSDRSLTSSDRRRGTFRAPPDFNGERPKEWLMQINRRGPELMPTTWEQFQDFIMQRFGMAPIVTTTRRLKEIEYKGSFEEVVEKFSSILAEGEEPSEGILKDLAATWYEYTTERFRREVERRDDLIRQGWVLNSKQDREQGQDKGWRHEQAKETGVGRLFCAEVITSHTPEQRDRKDLGCREGIHAISVAEGAMIKAKQFQRCGENGRQSLKQRQRKQMMTQHHSLCMQKGVNGLDCLQKEAEVKEDSLSEKQRTAKLTEVSRSAGPDDEEWGAGICPTSRKPSRRDGRTRQPHMQQQTEIEIHDAQSHTDVEAQDVPSSSRLVPENPEAGDKTCSDGLLDSRSQLWWRSATSEQDSQISHWVAAAVGEGRVWVLRVQIQGKTVEALVDTGASRSFIVPSLVTELAMGTSALYPHVRFKVASGEDFVVRLAVEGVAFVVGSLQSHHDFLVAQVPHKMILGADWLWKENVIWDFKEHTLCIKKHNNVHRLL
ncbi:hypothetical protein EBH_0056050 [Eimeria brunetti]|uniref:Retrotransposon gag domain-containing protein n=1 Tax=Eimeria brunetti TaxID=51314 RepID=U6LXG2_9EIME|nr:hypothetical protein EBH_0056050 [Eimeria brunetti]